MSKTKKSIVLRVGNIRHVCRWQNGQFVVQRISAVLGDGLLDLQVGEPSPFKGIGGKRIAEIIPPWKNGKGELHIRAKGSQKTVCVGGLAELL